MWIEQGRKILQAIQSLGTTVGAGNSNLTSINQRLTQIEGNLTKMSAQLDALQTQMAQVQTNLTATAASLTSIASGVAALDSQIQALAAQLAAGGTLSTADQAAVQGVVDASTALATQAAGISTASPVPPAA